MTAKLVQQHQPCPRTNECGSSDAYCEWDDGHGYCFSCNHRFNLRTGTDFLSEEFTYEFVPDRGLTRETLEFYGIKTKIDPSGEPVSVGFRYPDGTHKVRDLKKKSFTYNPAGADTVKMGLFGKDRFSSGSHKYVTITEGEYDAASLWQVLRSPVVSIKSASSARRDCVSDHEWLSGFERIYLAFDNDAAGREALKEVARLFDYNKIYVVKFTKYKDANDYLKAGLGDELRHIWWNSKKYLPETIISSFEEFNKILTEEPIVGVSYPWPTLNAMTYGIRPAESVLIRAQEKVGKTEFMHALEHHILKETKDAVGAIFLEEPKRRHLQALAGIELGVPLHLPDHSRPDSVVSTALQDLVGSDDRLHLYSHFGSDSPDVILDTIRFLVSARSCRYVLLDHLSMVVSGLAGEDERKALDYISTRLEMMVKELAFALIMVSHVNDEGKTRGSRYISKVADITIDLHRDLMNPDPIVRNTTRVSVPFNRFSGYTGPAGLLLFDHSKQKYREIEADNDNLNKEAA